jgi:hypothetical protein
VVAKNGTLSCDKNAPDAAVELSATGSCEVSIESEELAITDAYRLNFTAPDASSIGSPKKTSLVAKNPTELVRAVFASRSPASLATVSFPSKTLPIHLQADAEKDASLSARHCRLTKLFISGKLNEMLSELPDESLTIEFEALSNVSVKIIDSALAVTGSGTARSVQARGVELLPTVLDQLINKQSGFKGVWALLAVIVLLGAGVFLKQAFEVLAKSLMPGPSLNDER